MTVQVNKLVAFFKECEALNLPVDFCAFAYMELRHNSYTPEKFYSFFKDVYSNDDIFDYLKKMVDSQLLLAFDNGDFDKNIAFDDSSFLTLNIAYDPRISVIVE